MKRLISAKILNIEYIQLKFAKSALLNEFKINYKKS